jgi:galactokinase
MTKAELQEMFRNRFHQDATHFFFCPGRVNLIGEHIDYNGGKVMPCAISRGTYLAVAKNKDDQFRFECLNFPETASLDLQKSYVKTGKEWFNYPLGAVHQLLQEGYALSGLNMLFYGNLPIGAGLSSSASIEVLTMYAAKEIFGLKPTKTDIALLGKKVENDFIGVNSGIMDQFAVAMGEKDKAILLDCDTLEYEYLPFEIGNRVLAIINSNKQRTLADSKYNERFRECREALQLLNRELAITHLCDIDAATFQQYKHLITDPVIARRAEHVVMENERVRQARAALSEGDIARFGELMYASHDSLRDLYEVSGEELDTIVDFSRTYEGCIGARMTGAGFGGCAIALVSKDRFEDYSQKLILYYQERIGYAPEIFPSVISNGVEEIWKEA